MRGMRGFTLFEVLMALGIFAMAVVGSMVALNSVLSAAREVRLRDDIRSQLENRMAVLEGEELKEVERTVVGDRIGIRFNESIHKEKVTGKDGKILDGFWRATIVAEWESEGSKQEERVDFLRYGP